MSVKFNEYWNIIPEKMDEYIEFMQRSYIPTMNSLRINVVALWSVLIGESPQIVSEGVAEDLECIEIALKSEACKNSKTKLLTLVTDHKSKVMVPSGRFPQLPRTIETGIVKFSQYWDIIPGKEKEYDNFIRTEHYPAMEELGIRIAGEWNVLIGESPNVFYEGRADHAEQLLAALKSNKFRKMKYELLKLVSDYSSKVLVFHAFRTKGGKSKEYKFYLT